MARPGRADEPVADPCVPVVIRADLELAVVGVDEAKSVDATVRFQFIDHFTPSVG